MRWLFLVLAFLLLPGAAAVAQTPVGGAANSATTRFQSELERPDRGRAVWRHRRFESQRDDCQWRAGGGLCVGPLESPPRPVYACLALPGHRSRSNTAAAVYGIWSDGSTHCGQFRGNLLMRFWASPWRCYGALTSPGLTP